MSKALIAGLALFGTLAQAQEEAAPAPTPPAPAAEEKKQDEKGPFSPGRFILRGGINFDLNQSINLGGSSQGARVTLGANAGVGYFVIENLEIDLDFRFFMYLTPKPEVSSLEITPGARYRVWQNILLRVGVPIPIVPQFGVGILGGLAWSQPIASRVSFVIGVDYTYYFTEYYRTVAPAGRLDIHGGIQTWF